MIDHKRRTWLLIGGLVLGLMLGLALISPAPALGQGGGTPTHEPPPPRTLPPGIRQTPQLPQTENTPQPPGNPAEAPTPTPIIMLPVSGGSTGGGDPSLSLAFVLGGLGLCALGVGWAWRPRTGKQ